MARTRILFAIAALMLAMGGAAAPAVAASTQHTAPDGNIWDSTPAGEV
ncbi:hypothetical protein [Streptomyces sp. NBC_00199]|nr:hypothetical protein [Streptomyces sp. NBC_00199]MCX5265957.1 hypothetical protein [Streptomyces sp. NBC_00199]